MAGHILTRIERETAANAKPAIVPLIGGRARTTGIACGFAVAQWRRSGCSIVEKSCRILRNKLSRNEFAAHDFAI
jgi:hypothetical protein